MEDLHHLFGCSNIYLLMNKVKWDRIQMIFKFNMVINVNCGCFPFCIFIGFFGQWA